MAVSAAIFGGPRSLHPVGSGLVHVAAADAAMDGRRAVNFLVRVGALEELR